MRTITREYAEEDAARYDGTVVTWFTVLDNHDPYRASAAGFGIRYVNPSGIAGFKFWPPEELRKATRANYILDDGITTDPYYVSGRNPKNDPGALFAQMFPVNHTTTEGGRSTSRSGVLGPRLTYHLKITSVS